MVNISACITHALYTYTMCILFITHTNHTNMHTSHTIYTSPITSPITCYTSPMTFHITYNAYTSAVNKHRALYIIYNNACINVCITLSGSELYFINSGDLAMRQGVSKPMYCLNTTKTVTLSLIDRRYKCYELNYISKC